MRVLVGFSGGMDSMMTAALLSEAGHTVEGAVVVMHEHTDLSGAKSAAETLGLPLHILDARAEFAREVTDNFVREYRAARTPNPCIRCNRYVKIGKLYEYAVANGFDAFATGHYARVSSLGERFTVSRAADTKKDQSYVLWQLTQEMLARFLTPLADYDKATLREMARARGFAVAEQTESQDICFLPNGDYASYVLAHGGESHPGDFVLADGRVVGRHKGLIHYTVGQRKGLGIALGEPMFVTALNPRTNTVTLAPAAERCTLGFTADAPVYSGIVPPNGTSEAEMLVQLRYGARPIAARVTYTTERVEVTFAEPTALAVTPGQSAVFYDTDGNILLGALIAFAR